jgi:predicted O-methyltransferase YrrM
LAFVRRRLSIHTHAAVTSLREALHVYRESVVLGESAPEFAEALEVARHVEGFTEPIELSLIYHIAARQEECGAIVEIGSYLGRSTIVLARACRDFERGVVVAVDPHLGNLGLPGAKRPQTLDAFQDNLERAGVAANVEVVRTTAVDAGRAWNGSPVRLLFVDGIHTREAVLEDVLAWRAHLSPGCCVVFDDFLNSPGVRAAVRELVQSGTVRGERLIAGKMIGFGPRKTLRRVPVAPGSRVLSRLGDQPLDLLIKAFATRPTGG